MDRVTQLLFMILVKIFSTFYSTVYYYFLPLFILMMVFNTGKIIEPAPDGGADPVLIPGIHSDRTIQTFQNII